MSVTVLSLAGWAAAAAAIGGLVRCRRALASRADAVAQACHELRGPLASVQLGLALGGRRRTLSPEQLRAIELELGRAALALSDLEATRRRSAGAEAHEAVDVFGLLADSVAAWRVAGALRGVELALSWTGRPASVAGDRRRLAQATCNLIANAIEHGGGRVEVRGAASGAGVRIEVVDDGPGLSAPVEELARRSPCGARHGHGLRIAGSVAAAHGGRLADAPGARGACMVLELPRAPTTGDG